MTLRLVEATATYAVGAATPTTTTRCTLSEANAYVDPGQTSDFVEVALPTITCDAADALSLFIGNVGDPRRWTTKVPTLVDGAVYVGNTACEHLVRSTGTTEVEEGTLLPYPQVVSADFRRRTTFRIDFGTSTVRNGACPALAGQMSFTLELAAADVVGEPHNTCINE